MAKANFVLRVPDIEIDDTDACRRQLISVIQDPLLENVISDLRVVRTSAASSPAPRGGEASVSAETKSDGEWSIKAEAKITF